PRAERRALPVFLRASRRHRLARTPRLLPRGASRRGQGGRPEGLPGRGRRLALRGPGALADLVADQPAAGDAGVHGPPPHRTRAPAGARFIESLPPFSGFHASSPRPLLRGRGESLRTRCCSVTFTSTRPTPTAFFRCPRSSTSSDAPGTTSLRSPTTSSIATA